MALACGQHVEVRVAGTRVKPYESNGIRFERGGNIIFEVVLTSPERFTNKTGELDISVICKLIGKLVLLDVVARRLTLQDYVGDIFLNFVKPALCSAPSDLIQRLHQYRILIWDPEAITGHPVVACPCCNTNCVRSGKLDDWTTLLYKDIFQDVFIVSCRFKCTRSNHCGGRTFLTYRDPFLSQHPRLQSLFPAHMTAMSGVSADLVALTTTLAARNLSFKAIADSINEVKRVGVHTTQLGTLLNGTVSMVQPETIALNHGYLSDLFFNNIKGLDGIFMDVMAGTGARILQVDSGRKNSRKVQKDKKPVFKETTTFMNEKNEVVAVFHGNGGLEELEVAMRKMGLRFYLLRQEPIACYTDNPRGHTNILKRNFPSLGVGLHPGDDGIKQDLWHWLQRHNRSFLARHSLKKAAMNDLKDHVLVPDLEDVNKYAAATGTTAPLVGDQHKKHVRYRMPAPDVQLARYEAWVNKYKDCPDGNGKQLFTEATKGLIERSKKAIAAWRLSDPVVRGADGQWQYLEDMFIDTETREGRLPHYHCARGTNAVESFHSQAHHLLPGGSNTPEHFQALLTSLIGRWNLKAAVKYGGLRDPKTFRLDILDSIKRVAAEAGLSAAPFTLPQRDSLGLQERLHFAWKDDDTYAAVRGEKNADRRAELIKSALADQYADKVQRDWWYATPTAAPQPQV